MSALVVSLGKEHVLRLEIAVNDAGRVRPAEAAEGLRGEVERVEDREAPAREAGAEVFAVEELHHEERLARVGLAGVEDLDDVRALHRRDSARFAMKARQRRGIRPSVDDHELQRDALADRDVLRLVDRAHPAAPEEAKDLVLASRDRPYPGIHAVFARVARHAALPITVIQSGSIGPLPCARVNGEPPRRPRNPLVSRQISPSGRAGEASEASATPRKRSA